MTIVGRLIPDSTTWPGTDLARTASSCSRRLALRADIEVNVAAEWRSRLGARPGPVPPHLRHSADVDPGQPLTAVRRCLAARRPGGLEVGTKELSTARARCASRC